MHNTIPPLNPFPVLYCMGLAAFFWFWQIDGAVGALKSACIHNSEMLLHDPGDNSNHEQGVAAMNLKTILFQV